ncbi:MAG: amidohydrolase family protein [Bacteroidota bacterium]
MKINVHTHLFTLQNVLSAEAVKAIGNRLRHRRVPEYLVQGIEKFLNNMASKPRYLNEDELLSELVKSILSTQAFKDFAQGHLNDIPILKAINLDSHHLSKKALEQLLNALSAWGEAHDDSRSTLYDIYETLRIAMRPHSTSIADELLLHLQEDDMLVGLMMDIRGDTETARDERRFRQQMADLMEASLQRPGRILPFFAVNPKRPDHYELMKDALENKGFTGIKLYPSLGYKIDHPDLIKVYAYCEQHDVPMLMHCNHSGFYVHKDYISYCDPEHWYPILKQFPRLKLCFGHFAGEETLSKPQGLQPGSWGHKIVELMQNPEHPNIYADLSYHVEMMAHEKDEQHYLSALNTLMEKPLVRDRIVFGTDSWLLRLNISDELYWSYFRENLSEKHFAMITQKNPGSFVGISPLKANIRRYLDFQKKNSDKVGSLPASWLASTTGVAFQAKRDHPHWTLQRYPALVVLSCMKQQLYNKQFKLAFQRKAFITMQELKFWRFFYTNKAAFGQECRKLALDMVNQCDKQGAIPEGTLTQRQVMNTLEEMIGRPDTRLLDLAIQVEMMYEFKYD